MATCTFHFFDGHEDVRLLNESDVENVIYETDGVSWALVENDDSTEIWSFSLVDGRKDIVSDGECVVF